MDKREQQIRNIADAGIELYAETGFDGLSMREIAKKLNMSAKNLYNYIESKREIFIAMRIRFLESLEALISKVISKSNKNLLEIIIEIARKFMEWANENKEGFNILFLSEPPNANQIGPIERAYEPGKPLILVRDLIYDVLKLKNISSVDYDLFTAYIWQQVYSAAYVERGIRITRNFEEFSPFYQTGKNVIFQKLDPLKYREFTLNNLQIQLENYLELGFEKKEIEEKVIFIDKWIEKHSDNIKLTDYWFWIKEIDDSERILNFYEILRVNLISIEKNLEDLVKTAIK